VSGRREREESETEFLRERSTREKRVRVSGRRVREKRVEVKRERERDSIKCEVAFKKKTKIEIINCKVKFEISIYQTRLHRFFNFLIYIPNSHVGIIGHVAKILI
jgi:hypothetical protein